MRTLEEVKDLAVRFVEYTKVAEQREFELLLMIQLKLAETLNIISAKGIDNYPEEEIESMFRTIESIIGKAREEDIKNGNNESM